MGYSCTKAADDTLQEITERYRYQNTGNTLQIGDRAPIFYELGREQADGAVVGTVYVFYNERSEVQVLHNSNLAEIEKPKNQYAKKLGSFRINADGNIARFPGLPRKYWPHRQTQAEFRRALGF